MADTLELGSSTVDEFCRRHGVSKTTYYEMQKQGIGPREMRFGRIVRISPAAEADWIRATENPTAAIEASRAKLRQRARAAAAASVAGANHVSKRRPER